MDKNTEARLLGYSAFYTPMEVVRQGVSMALEKCYQTPRFFLDPSAGGGVFGKVIGELAPYTHRTGIEIREETRMEAARHYEDFKVGSLLTHFRGKVALFDLIMSNPPFHVWEETVTAMLPLLTPDRGRLILLGISTWGQRGRSANELFTAHPPSRQWRIPGAVSFTTGTTDSRDYSWFIWEANGNPAGSWLTENLPRLESKDRRHETC